MLTLAIILATELRVKKNFASHLIKVVVAKQVLLRNNRVFTVFMTFDVVVAMSYEVAKKHQSLLFHR